MPDEHLMEVQAKHGSEILQIPTVMRAVVVTYNLPQTGKWLKLSPEVLADIFRVNIRKWNDSRIISINRTMKLPDKAIGKVLTSKAKNIFIQTIIISPFKNRKAVIISVTAFSLSTFFKINYLE